MPGDGYERCYDKREWDAEDGPLANERPKVRIGETRNDCCRHPQEHNVVDRPKDDEGDKRREEGAQPEIADQIAVDRTADDAERHNGDKTEANWPALDIHANERKEDRERVNGSDGKIDAARNHHDRQAE